MNTFTVHTIDSAPEESKPPLRALKEKFGFIPNVAATMAESPALLNGFIGTFGNFHGGSFNEAEKQILLLTNAVAFKCPWTVAAHSTFALIDGVAASEVEAIRAGHLPSEQKYAALSALSRAVIEKKGNITPQEIEGFTAAGYSQNQIFEVIAGVGISTLTASTTNFASTPVDDVFKAQAWSAA